LGDCEGDEPQQANSVALVDQQLGIFDDGTFQRLAAEQETEVGTFERLAAEQETQDRVARQPEDSGEI